MLLAGWTATLFPLILTTSLQLTTLNPSSFFPGVAPPMVPMVPPRKQRAYPKIKVVMTNMKS